MGVFCKQKAIEGETAMTCQENGPERKILTIPNLLSVLRLCMIPIFVWLYCAEQNYFLTAIVLLLSGLTDMADGFIARRFHMISDFGKALDPVADKLTQAAMLFCLVIRFPMMWAPLIVLTLKEISSGIVSLLAIRKSGVVTGAVWHGKVTTVLLYAMMLIHLIWFDIPHTVSNVLIGLCVAMMLYSWGRYGWSHVKSLAEDRESE